jgi:ankyrin repeat protein
MRSTRSFAILSAVAFATAACGGEGAATSSPSPQATSPAPSTARPSPQLAKTTQAPKPSAKEQAKLNQQLIKAAWDNDLRRARGLIAKGADVNAKDNTVQSAYLISTSEGYLELLDLTLKHGAGVDSKDSFNGTGLIRAADRGHADIAGRLVQADVKINHINNLGWTALHEAIILGDGSRRYVDTVQVLVAARADLQLPSRRDQISPLEHATSKGHNEIAQVLRAALAADKPSSGWPIDACSQPPSAVRQQLRQSRFGPERILRRATSGDVRHCCSLPPMTGSASLGCWSIWAQILNALDDQHDTPWLVTGVTGSVEMLEVLLPAEPDVTIRNRFGGTSIIPASERGHVAYVRRAVRTGIDVNHVNDLGWTALLEAVILGDGSQRYQQIVTILLEAGADPKIADRQGVTALQHAERRGQREVARILRNA